MRFLEIYRSQMDYITGLIPPPLTADRLLVPNDNDLAQYSVFQH